MKTLYKAVIVSALGLGTIATAQAAVTYNSDLIIGFTTTTGNDVEYDAGAVGSLYSGEQFNLSAPLTGVNLSTVDWGVVANVTTSHSIYQTDANTPNTVAAFGAWNAINTSVKTIYNNAFSASGAGNSATPAASAAWSWNTETLNPTLGTDFLNEVGGANPNVVGETSVGFYGTADDGSAPNAIGTFSLDQTGTVTFTAVPEPTAYGVIAGAGLLVVSLRNRFSKKQA
jgi:hypothetical protein